MKSQVDLVCGDLVDSGGGPRVVGTIAWQLGDEVFPEEKWSDFPGVVLAWWMTALAGAPREGTKLRFMDGALWLEIGPMREGRVRVRGLEDRLRNPLVLTDSYEVELEHLRSLVLRAASQVLRFSREQGIHDRDVETLASHVETRMS